jgi:hypothetical protein
MQNPRNWNDVVQKRTYTSKAVVEEDEKEQKEKKERRR